MALEVVIADRGWVWVGETAVQDNGDVIISNAKNIERWGTTKGLGTKGLRRLALQGPQPTTTLRDVGTVRVSARAVIARIACEASKWS